MITKLKPRALSVIAMILVLIAGITSCTFTTPPCNRLVESQLRSIPWTTLDAGNFAQWVKDHYGLSPKRDGYRDDPAVVWSWSSMGKDYAAYFRPGVKRILIKFSALPPTVADVTGCFGLPNSYQAYYRYEADVYIFNFAVWYLKEGLVAVRPYYTHASEPASIHEDTQLPNIMLVPPGTPEEMVFQAYAQTSDPAAYAGEAKSLKPWPAKLTDIVVDVAPSYFGN